MVKKEYSVDGSLFEALERVGLGLGSCLNRDATLTSLYREIFDATNAAIFFFLPREQYKNTMVRGERERERGE